ncbi:hypothetical protein [Microbacterium indicum]|uniref:hypothetical protein n=1 Tax=Microbacterium indicum TaxID=358100 RepID=UPI000429A0A6|nr:hypothetical protein [Microbacterium indicum]
MKWWDRARRTPEDPRPASARHGRHGRAGRSALTRPPVPAVGSRFDRFDMTVTASVDFLRGAWPELRPVRFEVASMPLHDTGADVPRWSIDREKNRILIYRVPVERLSKAHGVPLNRTDEYHRRALVEGAVFRAAAEYLGVDPWDLGVDDLH